MNPAALILALAALSGVQALDWKSGPSFRAAPVAPNGSGKTGFTLLPSSDTGLAFTNRLAPASVARNRIYENGSGVALGDVDGDGLCDIYLCGLERPNALYRNLGHWRFQEITETAGVSCAGQYSTGAVFADIDGDGDLDLLVNGIGAGTRAFLNDGKGHFTELLGSRLVRRFGSTSLALADIDGDGDLDLYVTNYRTDTYQDRPAGLKVEASMVGGKIVVTPADRFIPIVPRGGGVEVIELGDRDFLYINDGQGKFAPASWTSGAFLDEQGAPLKEAPKDWGLSVMLRDLNGDGKPDIYVCNDFFHSPDRIWLSQTHGGFRAAPVTAFRQISMSSMAVDVADINRDGYDDIFVADMLSRSPADRHRQRPNMMKGIVEIPLSDPNFRPETARNTFFLNRGDGTYAEIAQLSGLAATEWTWNALFLDVDLDGYEDLLIANGNFHDVQDADAMREVRRIREKESPETRLAHFPLLERKNLAFRNRGDLTFEETGAAWGFDLNGISQGMALADLDNDGDLDVVINNLNGPAAIYRNNSPAPRIAVRLKGRVPNTRGIGARIKVIAGKIEQTQEMICGGRYLSGDDAERVFAAPGPSGGMRLEVTWRDGGKSVIASALPNHIYELDQAGAQAVPPPAKSEPKPLFEDVSHLLGHTHVDEPFDDFARQPLLSRKLSQLGPGVAWLDFDQDGFEDLAIGTGRSARINLFRNDRKGGFIPAAPAFEPAAHDLTALLPWIQGSNVVILAGNANYEDGGDLSAVLLADPRTGALQPLLPPLGGGASVPASRFPSPQSGSTGPLAMADIDGDGFLDLLVCGRAAAGKYPEPVSSHIYRGTATGFTLDAENETPLRNIGLVSGALFSDLDDDGLPDLVLACEWGPLRIFKNERGKFREATEEFGLAGLAGWWNSVAAGDFDGDGQMDLVAGNWGRNTRFEEARPGGAHAYFGDFDQNGTLEVIEAISDAGGKITPIRDYETILRAFPSLSERITSFRQYGNASVAELIGSTNAAHLHATVFESMVFLNRRGRFEARPLPVQAQFAPVFGIAVSDFNGDGAEDIFLAQNFFDVEPETSRFDGGQGLLLLGDGKGSFRSSPAIESGIAIYGEQRGAACADFDGDGRVDLVVAQNRGGTKLFRNTQARAGFRLKLTGSSGNPNAVGARIRLERGGLRGPAREIHAGSGYWSQNGVVQVFPKGGNSVTLWVRWPNHKETFTKIDSASAKEVLVKQPE